MTKATLRGYAIPFDTMITLANGEREIIARGAFDEMLARRDRVQLQFETHDPAPPMARTGNGSLRLFVDSFGLGFEADVQPMHRDWWQIGAVTRRDEPFNRASIQFSRRDTVKTTSGGVTTHRVTAASVGHIAIVRAGHAAYDATRVWRSDAGMDAAPWEIQCLNEDWKIGRALYRRPALASSTPANVTRRMQHNAPALRTSAHNPREHLRLYNAAAPYLDKEARIAFLLAPSKHRNAELRAAWAHGARSGSISGELIAHVAFSRAGGWTGKL